MGYMKKNSRPTLYDVATAAGVGTTTVSRVINGGHRVNPETLRKVQTIMKRLGYQPSQAARSLRGDRTRTVGLIVPTIADHFFAELANAAQAVARRNDYALMLLTSDDDAELEATDLQVFERHRIDGLLLIPPRSHSRLILSHLESLAIPAICIDRPIGKIEISSVICDNYLASKEAVEHLIGHGRKRILCLGGDPRLYSIRERARGYLSAMEKAQLPTIVNMNIFTCEAAEAALRERFAEPGGVDAVFGLKSPATVAAYEALRRMGIRLPEEVSLLGFDDFPLASLLNPPISVVQQPIHEMGTTAAQLLFDILANPGMPAKHVEVVTHLLIRESCGCNGAPK
jgi:LacI family transcriptional regulator